MASLPQQLELGAGVRAAGITYGGHPGADELVGKEGVERATVLCLEICAAEDGSDVSMGVDQARQDGLPGRVDAMEAFRDHHISGPAHPRDTVAVGEHGCVIDGGPPRRQRAAHR